MKRRIKCPAFLLIVITGLMLTAAGIAGRFSIYKDSDFDVVKEPFLTLVLDGISRGEMPWDGFDMNVSSWENWNSSEEMEEGKSDTDVGQSIENPGEAETVVGDNVTEDNVTEDNVTGDEGAKVLADGEAVIPEAETGVTYGFSQVTEDYFNDAVFIGDSRTVGLFEYGGIEERADFFAKISLTIYDVFTEPVAKDEETGKKITVEEALAKKQYGKVYLMLGINELGTGTTESFMEEYVKVVERLRELQPNAIIFVQGIMRVTGSKNETDPIFNNTHINEKNAEIAKLADNTNIFYIDVNEVVCDENGNLNQEYTIDEIHLKARYYSIWKEFLLSHGVVR